MKRIIVGAALAILTGHMYLVTGAPKQVAIDSPVVLATQYPEVQTSSNSYAEAPKAVSQPKAAPVSNCSDAMNKAGIPSTHATNSLINNESGCQPGRLNPSSFACGIAQSLPCTKVYPHATPEWIRANRYQVGGKWFIPGDAVTELRWMAGYVANRYGSWESAWAFWQRTDPRPYPGHWY